LSPTSIAQLFAENILALLLARQTGFLFGLAWPLFLPVPFQGSNQSPHHGKTEKQTQHASIAAAVRGY